MASELNDIASVAAKDGFKKGARGRPAGPAKNKGGRPKGSGKGPQAITRRQVMIARQLFQEYAEEARDVMVAIMQDPEADPAVRLKASNDILNRAYGTPVNISVQEKIVSTERGSPISGAAISAAGTAELEQLASVLARFVEAERNTIEVVPEMPEGYPEEG